MANITYPLDTSGVAASNLITSELHTVSESNYRDYYFIVPNFAPFYTDRFKLLYILNGTQRELAENVDYSFALPYVAGIRSVGKLIYGAVTLNNLDTNGILAFQYQTLGGEWVVDRLHVLQHLAEKVYNPRLTVWDVVTDKPDVFPPMPHYQDYDQFYGQEELIGALSQISSTIIGSSQSSTVVRHLTNHENPHEVTKEQIGLGNLQNWRLATIPETLTGVSFDTLITPLTLQSKLTNIDERITAIDGRATTGLVAQLEHLANLANPHEVTKAQVGLGNVENYAMASEYDILNRQAVNKYATLRQIINLLDHAYIEKVFGVAPGSLLIEGGQTLTFSYDSIGVPYAKTLYWTVESDSLDVDDLENMFGAFTTDTTGKGSFAITAKLVADAIRYKEFRVAVRLAGLTGTVLTTSAPIVLYQTYSEDIPPIVNDPTNFTHQEYISPARLFLVGEPIDITHTTGTGNDSIISEPEFEGWVARIGGANTEGFQEVAMSSDGTAIYAVGYQYSQSAGGYDAYITRWDANGVLVWQRSIGGNSSDYFKGVAVSPDGSAIYAVGYQISQAVGSFDAYITCWNASGTLMWQRTIGGNMDDRFQAVIVSPNGTSVYAVGQQSSVTYGMNDAYITRWNADGTLVWQRSIGGASDDCFNGVAVSPDGTTIYAVGAQQSQSTGGYDAYITRWDAVGNLTWQRSVGGSQGDYFQNVVIAPDGTAIYAVGYQASDAVADDDHAYITRWGADGSLVWQRSVGDSNNDSFEGVAISPDGTAIYAVGYQQFQTYGANDAYIACWDTAGNLVWQRSIGGSGNYDRFQGVVASPDGTAIYAVGEQNSQTAGVNDAFIVAIATTGAVVEGPLTGTDMASLSWSIPTLIASTPTLAAATRTLPAVTPSLTVVTRTLPVATPTLTSYLAGY